MIFDENELAAAVIFVGTDGRISKQMNIGEFQAVLDGYVPLVDLAGKEARAVYVEINCKLHVRRAVFFRLPINDSGEIIRSWHLPLMDLATSGVEKYDIGSGLIKVSCYSHCEIDSARDKLWDPDLSPNSEFSKSLVQAVSRNSLALQFRDPDPQTITSISQNERLKIEHEISSRLRQEFEQELHSHKSQIEKENHIQEELEKNAYIADQARKYEDIIQMYKIRLEEKDSKLAEQFEKNERLQSALEGQSTKIDGMREYFDKKIDEAKALSLEVVSSEQVEKEQQNRSVIEQLEADVQALKQDLQIREVEVLYMNEMKAQLQGEVACLKKDLQDAETRDSLLKRLAEKGIRLVCFQSGLGHMTIPLNEIVEYLENEVQYLAKKVNVSEQVYTEWLDHYNMPVCKRKTNELDICGENIDRVESPAQFKSGESDCCPQCRKVVTLPHVLIANQ